MIGAYIGTRIWCGEVDDSNGGERDDVLCVVCVIGVVVVEMIREGLELEGTGVG